jgi:hypothetical protein
MNNLRRQAALGLALRRRLRNVRAQNARFARRDFTVPVHGPRACCVRVRTWSRNVSEMETDQMTTKTLIGRRVLVGVVAAAVCFTCSIAGAGLWQIDLDHSSTPVTETGWLSVQRPNDGSGTAGQYTVGLGYGWQSPAGIAARERSGTGLGFDFHFDDVAQTFLIDTGNAVCDVTLYFQDRGYQPHDDISVWVEGTKYVDDITSGYGSMVTAEFQVTVSDGQFTLLIDEEGVGGDANWVLNAIEVDAQAIGGGASIPEIGGLGLIGLALFGLKKRRS